MPAENLQTLSWSVPSHLVGERCDVVVVQLINDLEEEIYEQMFGVDREISRAQIVKWIEKGALKVGGKAVKRSFKLEPDDQIELTVEREIGKIKPDSSIEFTIVYEDEAVIVVDKPPGLVVHPGAGVDGGTLVHGLVHHLGAELQPIGDSLRPGIVHRLDKDTSGLMVVAKTEVSYRHLVNQFQPPRTVSRTYLALCHRRPRGIPSLSGTISLPIGRSQGNRTRMAVDQQSGREAITHWQLLEEFESGVLMELLLETGRTHQIRVHLEAVGAPIVGDPVYRRYVGALPQRLQKIVEDFNRQALHACRLSFVHPSTGDVLTFESTPPEPMLELIESFRTGE